MQIKVDDWSSKYNTLNITKGKIEKDKQEELNNLAQKLKDLEAKYNQLIPNHQNTVKEKDSAILDLKNRYRVLESNFTGKDKEINILKSNIGSWENKAKQLQIELDKKPKEVIKEVEVVKTVTDEKALNALQAKFDVLQKNNNNLEAELKKKPKEVEVVKTVTDEKALNALRAKFDVLQKSNKDLEAELKKKPKEVEVIKEVVKEIEVIREVPVEIIKEVEVVKSFDMETLQKMMMQAGTVEVSKTVVGEKRVVGKAKTVKQKASKAKPAAKSTAKAKKAKKDDLKKIEGIGPKIAGLLNKGDIITFKDLAKAKVSTLKKILDDAGPRYQMHDPSTWAKQSALARDDKWDELEKLQDNLKGGRKA